MTMNVRDRKNPHLKFLIVYFEQFIVRGVASLHMRSLQSP